MCKHATYTTSSGRWMHPQCAELLLVTTLSDSNSYNPISLSTNKHLACSIHHTWNHFLKEPCSQSRVVLFKMGNAAKNRGRCRIRRPDCTCELRPRVLS